MKKVAIIGATGEVGYRLVGALYPFYKIVGIVRNTKKKDFKLYPGVEIRQLDDISDIDELSRAFEGCDAVINTGYIWFAEQIHQALLSSTNSIQHVVFTGSTGIYTRLPSPSAELKRTSEAFIRKSYRCNWTIIRPTMIYGHKDDRNISRLVRTIARYPILPLIGSGTCLIQPVLVHDLIKAYQKVLLAPRHYGKSYDIAGGKAYTNRELISCAAAGLGKRVNMVSFPAVVVSAGVSVLSLFGLSPISKEQVQRFQENKDVDLSAFIENFGYVPQDFEQGVRLLIEDMRESGLLSFPGKQNR